MRLVFQRVNQLPDDKKRDQFTKLIKIFKTWEVLRLFDRNTLMEIHSTLRLSELERLISPDQMAKIIQLKERLEPHFLPIDVVQRGRIIHGTQLNEAEIRQKFMRAFSQMGMQQPAQ